MKKPNIKTAPLQELFDYAVTKVIEQGVPSEAPTLDEDGERTGSQCLYRGPDGLKCAAGWLLTDAEAAKEREGTAFSCTQIAKTLPADRVQMIEALQSAHDDAGAGPSFVNQFKMRAEPVAGRYGLEWKL